MQKLKPHNDIVEKSLFKSKSVWGEWY